MVGEPSQWYFVSMHFPNQNKFNLYDLQMKAYSIFKVQKYEIKEPKLSKNIKRGISIAFLNTM